MIVEKHRGEERFSGHESFVCRYGWLRKAYDGVTDSPALFSNLDNAIVALGVGSNMVRSLEFWARAFGVVEVQEGVHRTTALGDALLHPTTGKDPYLEDLGTLWLLHWKLVTRGNLAAWNLLFQDVHEWRIPLDQLFEMLMRRGRRSSGSLAESTVRQHLDILINTYTTPRVGDVRALEETLGSPLHELGLLTLLQIESRERVVEIRTGPKPTLSAVVFLSAVVDHWERFDSASASISLQELTFGKLSPGMVFRLDEESVAQFLSEFERLTNGLLTFQEGALIRGVQLSRTLKVADLRKRLDLL